MAILEPHLNHFHVWKLGFDLPNLSLVVVETEPRDFLGNQRVFQGIHMLSKYNSVGFLVLDLDECEVQ